METLSDAGVHPYHVELQATIRIPRNAAETQGLQQSCSPEGLREGQKIKK